MANKLRRSNAHLFLSEMQMSRMTFPGIFFPSIFFLPLRKEPSVELVGPQPTQVTWVLESLVEISYSRGSPWLREA